MTNALKFLLYVILALFGVFLVIGLVGKLVQLILGIAIPLAIIGGVGYILYAVFVRKSLSGGGRSLP